MDGTGSAANLFFATAGLVFISVLAFLLILRKLRKVVAA